MYLIQFMFNKLSEKPAIGIVSGFSSGFLLSVQNFLSNGHTLEMVANFGVWAGSIVAGLTAVLKTIELVDKLAKRFKHKKS